MNELLTTAFEEAAEHARTLPGEPVGVAVFVFSEDGTSAPMICSLPEHTETVATCLPSAASRMAQQLAEQIVEQRRAEPLPHDNRADLIEAERIMKMVIAKARG